jgi:4-hydroxy-2-oxoheptanedioate aldolase
MRRNNTLKVKLKEGRRCVGCLVALPSADVAEIMAYAGFDFLFVDHEHGAGALGDAVAQMRATKGSDTTTLVRIPANDDVYLQRLLDAGADGIVCPVVENAEQAAAMASACLYPPHGVRGAGGNTRAAAYGFDAEYAEHLRESLLIAVQIETLRGLEHIEDICRIPMIDAVFIGPRDLSASLGKLNQFADPELIALLRETEHRVLATGKYLGGIVYPGVTINAMFERGYHMLIVGTDVGILATGAKAVLAERR